MSPTAPPRTDLDPARVILVTAPTVDVAESLARALVGEGLAACANLVPGIRSIYRWKGEICEDAEVLLILKTLDAAVPALTARVTALHPYDLPEVLCLPVAGGSLAYLEWIANNVSTVGAPE